MGADSPRWWPGSGRTVSTRRPPAAPVWRFAQSAASSTIATLLGRCPQSRHRRVRSRSPSRAADFCASRRKGRSTARSRHSSRSHNSARPAVVPVVWTGSGKNKLGSYGVSRWHRCVSVWRILPVRSCLCDKVIKLTRIHTKFARGFTKKNVQPAPSRRPMWTREMRSNSFPCHSVRTRCDSVSA